jgi:acyl carrier protein
MRHGIYIFEEYRMSEQQILDRITPIFRDVFQDDTLVASSDMTANTVEKWDSLTHIDMIVMVEEEFGIRVPTSEITKMKNVGDLVRIIEKQTAA